MELTKTELTEWLWFRQWWNYSADAGWLDEVYHWFNIIEGLAWLVCTSVVARRYFSDPKSRVELLYAFAFLTFAASDFREAWVQQSWLLWLKLLNLIVLFRLRRHVMKQLRPSARLV